jgi:hypothetical protein
LLSLKDILSKPEPIVVVYHQNCMDGFAAAYCAWHVLGDRATYLPKQYGDVFDGLPPGKLSIIMVDVSFPKDIMDMVAADHNLVVLDHHKTAQAALQGAQAALQGAQYALFDMNKSGAMLAYEYFRPELPRGQGLEFIEYIQDRDLWKWEKVQSREFSAGLQSYDFDFQVWSELTVVGLTRAGHDILRFLKQQVERIGKQAYDCHFNGVPGKIVNSPVFQSELGEHLLAAHPEIRFASIVYENTACERVFSLRSRTIEGKAELDVSEMAKQMGGGGHPAAAGFKIAPKVDEDRNEKKPQSFSHVAPVAA